MQLTCHCPGCDQTARTDVGLDQTAWTCPQCGQAHNLAKFSITDGLPSNCLCCGNPDLWRQKDFPQSVGLLMVALGAILSSIAWAYHRPILALSTLAGFALTDMVLYWVMPDVLVCYRCRTHHSVTGAGGDFGPYDHELGERYRQERLRLEQELPGGRAVTPG